MDGRTNRRVRRARAVGRLTPTLAPSDVGARPRAGVRVGGRVAWVEGRALRVADALGFVDVVLCADSELEPGDLVVLSGRARGGRLLEATVVERFVHDTPRGDGEVARLAWHGVGKDLAARAVCLAEIRAFFAEQRFIEIDGPLRVRTPGLDFHVDALDAEGGFLCTSPELQLKRLLVGGLPRIYQLSHCFRADEVGPSHEPEFAMLEWYRAFAGQLEVMADTELLVERVVGRLAGRPSCRLPDGRRLDVRAPFPRLTVREAFRRYAGVADAVDLCGSDEDRFFALLVERVEPALAKLRRPVFLCEYPAAVASLARISPGDATVAERFELYAAGLELCNGFGELTDGREQRARFRNEQQKRRERRRPVYALDERFLGALGEGMPPAGGNALGVDRLVALALGRASIASVMPFPWERL